MAHLDIETRVDAELGEGALWDDATGDLLSVDMITGTVFRTGLGRGRSGSIRQTLGGYVGAVLLTDGPGIVTVTFTGLEHVLADRTTSIAKILDDSERRLNDAASDLRGRVWVGSTFIDNRTGGGALHVWSARDGVRTVASGLTLPNGIGFSPQNDIIYVADSNQGCVLSAPFDVDTGDIGLLESLFAIDEGVPDGLCVDADGSLWVAIWDGARVEHRAPDGSLVEAIALPVARPTSCAPVPGLGLAITTARFGLEDSDLAAQESAGSLIVVPGIGTALPTSRVALR